jgi:hypothetical protein
MRNGILHNARRVKIIGVHSIRDIPVHKDVAWFTWELGIPRQRVSHAIRVWDLLTVTDGCLRHPTVCTAWEVDVPSQYMSRMRFKWHIIPIQSISGA